MILLKEYIHNLALSLGFTIVTIAMVACGGSKGTEAPAEDENSKALLQGVWNSDLEGNTILSVRGDSIYFNDSLSTPAPFFVRNDTLFINYHKQVTYPIKKLTKAYFAFFNTDGDLVELTKTADKFDPSKASKYVKPNQGKTIKKDSVLSNGDNHFHAYTQVNPTTYKVYRQSTNNDGINVESVYYDNIVYIALYNGPKKIFGQNITKKDFIKLVPQSYLSQAILSDIVIDRASAKGVRFIAILSIPDSYTTYNVNIDITPEGNKTMSL